MKIREDYPVYINPSFDELIELAQSRWDTIRIGIDVDTGELILGSGYGNTHQSLVLALRAHRKKKYVDIDTFILYRDREVAYFNLQDCSGPRDARYEIWSQFFDDAIIDVLRDLIRESGLTL